jgi:transposase
MEIQKPNQRRRYHPEAFKLAVIDACREPGASVAGIAMANGVNANQVRRWMRERSIEITKRQMSIPASQPMPVTAPEFIQLPLAPSAPVMSDIRIEIRRANTALTVNWPVQASGDCAAWLRDWLR